MYLIYREKTKWVWKKYLKTWEILLRVGERRGEERERMKQRRGEKGKKLGKYFRIDPSVLGGVRGYKKYREKQWEAKIPKIFLEFKKVLFRLHSIG